MCSRILKFLHNQEFSSLGKKEFIINWKRGAREELPILKLDYQEELLAALEISRKDQLLPNPGDRGNGCTRALLCSGQTTSK